MVTRHVLMAPPARPDVRALDLRPGDRILLSSDGLHGLVDDATLAAILTDYPDPAAACQALIDAANHAGGPDNITAVVINADQLPPRRPPSPTPAGPPQQRPKRTSMRLPALAAPTRISSPRPGNHDDFRASNETDNGSGTNRVALCRGRSSRRSGGR